MLSIRSSDVLAGFRYYHYTPSLPAAALFVVLFALATGLHAYQMFRTRTWFMIAFCIGGLLELIGYIGRAMSAAQQPGAWTLGPFVLQSTLLLVAPALFAASIYMELGRIVQMVDGDAHLFIRRRWMTKIFVCGDVLSFLMQGSGGGLMSGKSADSIKTGQNIVVGGLWVQIIFFGMFVATATFFHLRLRKVPTDRSAVTPWRKHMFALYLTSGLILVRSAVRVVEYLQGFTGYLLEHEVFLYVFDAMLMLSVMLIMNWIHPSEVRACIRGGKSVTGLRLAAVSV
ncbi:hypothetical protein LTR16_001809 [Cryomyces antarcticus]|uniref:RTA1 like protein n=1 Tax=Cryomyces antarcticus TaxID=329879 RepID=A0ABR0LQ11_9PEZI|nr:hypothetical protein LTR60_000659 [Cryomyces antarcticus]KAK5201685.1 hypothetical protein LTR16_001809 [Cryomyces antarcticus]